MTDEIKARIGLKGSANPNYKGGWMHDTGRIYIGKIARARIVWDAAHPNDFVKPGEIIHHVNLVKTDDRPENLAKMTQSEHAILHDFGHS